MNTIRILFAFILLNCLGSYMLYPQNNFDPILYMQFLDENKSLTTSELLGNNPPKTTYFSDRLYPVSLNDISWYDSVNRVFNLTKGETELLARNFFVVTERINNYDWIYAFIHIYNNDLPLFISTDFILHSLHNSYDNILMTLEWQFLEPNLIILLQAMYDMYPALYNKYSDDERFREALSDVDLYVSVARSLVLNNIFEPQYHDNNKYQEVMLAIDSEQMSSMKLFSDTRTRNIDFSQFRPRGHYDKVIWTNEGQKTLENYFRAMMWMGRIDFLLTAPPENPWEKGWSDDDLRRMRLNALLLNELLNTCGAKHLLDKHEQILEFLVGPADNLTPDELYGLTSRLLTSPADLFNERLFEEFTDSLNASDDYGQKIMSNFFLVDPYSSDPSKLPVSFKLMGQKFLLDSYIFSEVVYDRIIYNNGKIFRGLPDPLDVMAVLGNEDAIALLEDEMELYKYAYKISSLKYLVDSYDEDFWEQSLYNTWLDAIRELNPLSCSDNLPYFMKTTAWHHKKLNTQLTSWAQLRHDNILYGKQSYTGGTSCSYPYTCIEPYPEFYRRLQVFAENAETFFQGVFEGSQFEAAERVIQYYSRYAEMMSIFKTISEKELSGLPINEEEITFLKTMINGYMASGPSISGWFTDFFFDVTAGMGWDFTVADVHTQPTDEAGNPVGHVLHVGNGLINMGIFLAPNPVNPRHLICFAGPVSSFHYEVTDNYYRYTDEEWKEKFLSYEIPPRPDWVAEYLAGKKGEVLMGGRKLSGIVNTEMYTHTREEVNECDYLLVFPNPASGKTHLRFVLNQKVPVTIEVFDLSGRLLYRPVKSDLPPAEHIIPIDLTGWEKGMYLLRFRAGNEVIAREIAVY